MIELRTKFDYLIAYSIPVYVALFLADLLWPSVFAFVMALQAINFYLMAKQHALQDEMQRLKPL